MADAGPSIHANAFHARRSHFRSKKSQTVGLTLRESSPDFWKRSLGDMKCCKSPVAPSTHSANGAQIHHSLLTGKCGFRSAVIVSLALPAV